MLCGKDAAHQHYRLSKVIIGASMKFKCSIPDKEPIVKNAMLIASKSDKLIYNLLYIFLFNSISLFYFN